MLKLTIFKYGLNIYETKNRRYLDNFLTKPLYFIVYSGDSDPNSPKNHKKLVHLVRNFLDIAQLNPNQPPLRRPIPRQNLRINPSLPLTNFNNWPWFNILVITCQRLDQVWRPAGILRLYLGNFLTKCYDILWFLDVSRRDLPELHKK